MKQASLEISSPWQRDDNYSTHLTSLSSDARAMWPEESSTSPQISCLCGPLVGRALVPCSGATWPVQQVPKRRYLRVKGGRKEGDQARFCCQGLVYWEECTAFKALKQELKQELKLRVGEYWEVPKDVRWIIKLQDIPLKQRGNSIPGTYSLKRNLLRDIWCLLRLKHPVIAPGIFLEEAFVQQSHNLTAAILGVSICGHTAQSHVATLSYTVTKRPGPNPIWLPTLLSNFHPKIP